MDGIDIHAGMSVEQIVAAADALRTLVDAAAAWVPDTLNELQRAPLASPANIDDAMRVRMQNIRREIEIAQTMATSKVTVAKANLLLAIAMNARLAARGKNEGDYRAACEAAASSADLVEFTAVTQRELYTRLDVPLNEQEAHEIKEAIKYARSCRTEIGFL